MDVPFPDPPVAAAADRFGRRAEPLFMLHCTKSQALFRDAKIVGKMRPFTGNLA
jgi:hypothetical protein